MTIVAKKVSLNGTVSNVVLPDDPSVQDIIDQFPGAVNYRWVCKAGGYEANHGVYNNNQAEVDCEILIVGEELPMGTSQNRRKCASGLADNKARNLARAAREKLGKNC